MLGFNVDEFEVINKMCEGVSSSHRHDGWGPERISKEVWATTMETAYPMPLARLIAAQFILALQRLGISRPAQTLSEISCTDNAVLPVLRAQAGGQPKAARLPPLIPHFAARLSLTGFRTDLPSFGVLQTIGAGDQHNECANNTPQGFKTFATLSCSAAFNSLSRGGGVCVKAAFESRRGGQDCTVMQSGAKPERWWIMGIRPLYSFVCLMSSKTR